MYLKKVSILLFLSLVVVGCSGKSYVSKHEKKPSIIQDNRLPSSVHETIGRYRKEL